MDEKINFLNPRKNYRIFSENGNRIIAICTEKNNLVFQLLRVIGYSRLIPYSLSIIGEEGKVLTVKRSFFQNQGYLKIQSTNSVLTGHVNTGKKNWLEVSLNNSNDLLVIQRESKEDAYYHYAFSCKGQKVAYMTKEWKGKVMNEPFATSNKYRLQLSSDIEDQHDLKQLILAVSLSIDLVYKEQ